MAYGQSNQLVALLGPQIRRPRRRRPTVVTGIGRNEVTTTNNWQTKARYDRFFTANNAGYASGQAAADRIAGKSFAGGGQIGYSRQLYKSDVHLCVSELGYDYSYERYVAQPDRTHRPGQHPFRPPFRGRDDEDFADQRRDRERRGALQPEPRIQGSRLRQRTTPDPGRGRVPRHPRRRQAGPHHDGAGPPERRLRLHAALRPESTAPPDPQRDPGRHPYAPGVQPFSDKVDTLAEATLIYTFI